MMMMVVVVVVVSPWCPVPQSPLFVHQPAAAAAAAVADADAARARFETADPEAIGEAGAAGAAGAAGGAVDGGPTWLARLRSALPLPVPECQSYFAFARSQRNMLSASPTASYLRCPNARPASYYADPSKAQACSVKNPSVYLPCRAHSAICSVCLLPPASHLLPGTVPPSYR